MNKFTKKRIGTDAFGYGLYEYRGFKIQNEALDGYPTWIAGIEWVGCKRFLDIIYMKHNEPRIYKNHEGTNITCEPTLNELIETIDEALANEDAFICINTPFYMKHNPEDEMDMSVVIDKSMFEM